MTSSTKTEVHDILHCRQGTEPRPQLTCIENFVKFGNVVFTARRNARIASVVLDTAIPSVCPSVTRRYCVKTTARSTVQFALSDSKMCFVETKKYSSGTTPSP